MTCTHANATTTKIAPKVVMTYCPDCWTQMCAVHPLFLAPRTV